MLLFQNSTDELAAIQKEHEEAEEQKGKEEEEAKMKEEAAATQKANEEGKTDPEAKQESQEANSREKSKETVETTPSDACMKVDETVDEASTDGRNDSASKSTELSSNFGESSETKTVSETKMDTDKEANNTDKPIREKSVEETKPTADGASSDKSVAKGDADVKNGEKESEKAKTEGTDDNLLSNQKWVVLLSDTSSNICDCAEVTVQRLCYQF